MINVFVGFRVEVPLVIDWRAIKFSGEDLLQVCQFQYLFAQLIIIKDSLHVQVVSQSKVFLVFVSGLVLDYS